VAPAKPDRQVTVRPLRPASLGRRPRTAAVPVEDGTSPPPRRRPAGSRRRAARRTARTRGLVAACQQTKEASFDGRYRLFFEWTSRLNVTQKVYFVILRTENSLGRL